MERKYIFRDQIKRALRTRVSFGLIVRTTLENIEHIQRAIEKALEEDAKIVYHLVTPSLLWIVDKKEGAVEDE